MGGRDLGGVPQHDYLAGRAGRPAGRLSGLQIAVVAGGPRLGNLEAGTVAAAFGDTVSVVSGGLACIAGALVLARLLPGFRKQRTPERSRQQERTDGAGPSERAD
jgi:hypothetical protein